MLAEPLISWRMPGQIASAGRNYRRANRILANRRVNEAELVILPSCGHTLRQNRERAYQSVRPTPATPGKSQQAWPCSANSSGNLCTLPSFISLVDAIDYPHRKPPVKQLFIPIGKNILDPAFPVWIMGVRPALNRTPTGVVLPVRILFGGPQLNRRETA